MMRLFGCVLLATLGVSIVSEAARAAGKVGVAAAVKNDVHRVTGGGTQPLVLGSDLFTNERIRTGEASTAQILFVDKTSLMIGPRAELTLDRFVYEPNKGTGQVVLNAVRGAFRFVTGSQDPRNYTIKTPAGTVGIRGTVVDLQVVNNPVTHEVQVIVILVQGGLTMTVAGKQYTLNKPGTAYTISGNGNVQGPATWNGTIVNTGGDVSFPLYGWTFEGEQLNNGLPNLNVGGIDQLNGVIQRSLTPPAVTRGGGSGG